MDRLGLAVSSGGSLIKWESSIGSASARRGAAWAFRLSPIDPKNAINDPLTIDVDVLLTTDLRSCPGIPQCHCILERLTNRWNPTFSVYESCTRDLAK